LAYAKAVTTTALGRANTFEAATGPSMKRMTNRQLEILNFIIDFKLEHEVAPTNAEIADKFGFSSPNAAFEHLAAMEKKNLIAINRRLTRSIKVTAPREL
jgi:repressor LexA